VPSGAGDLARPLEIRDRVRDMLENVGEHDQVEVAELT
jgi:hypothetical protein